jgi:hypothetical protein
MDLHVSHGNFRANFSFMNAKFHVWFIKSFITDKPLLQNEFFSVEAAMDEITKAGEIEIEAIGGLDFPSILTLTRKN